MRFLTPLAVLVLSAGWHTLAAQYDCYNLLQIPEPDANVRGKVTSADHHRAIPEIIIIVDGAPLGMTNCSGKFELPRLDPGSYWLSTHSEYFFPDSQFITLPGATDPLKVDLHPRLRPPALPPSRSLSGGWDLLVATSEADTILTLAARLWIGRGKRTRLAMQYPGIPDLRSGVLEQLFINAGDTISIDGKRLPMQHLIRKEVPVRAMGDSVEIWLTPGTFDAGYSIYGILAGDTIAGTLCAHNFAHGCVPLFRVRMQARK